MHWSAKGGSSFSWARASTAKTTGRPTESQTEKQPNRGIACTERTPPRTLQFGLAFDVPDLTKVLPEAYKPVEEGLLSDDDFRISCLPMACVPGARRDLRK